MTRPIHHPSLSLIRTRHHTSGDRTGTLPPFLRPIRTWTIPPADRTGIHSPPQRLIRTRHHPSGDRTGTLPPFLRPMRIWTIPPDDRTGNLLPPRRLIRTRYHLSGDRTGFLSPTPHPMRIWTSPFQTTVRVISPEYNHPQCGPEPFPQGDRPGISRPNHTLCGSGPSPQMTVRVSITTTTTPYADLDHPSDDRTGILLPPIRPMRIWISSPQTTVRADYHQYHPHTALRSSEEQHIRSQT